MKIKIIALFIILLLISPGFLFAGGNNYISLFGARSLAVDGLYYAGSDGLTCSLSNPAGFAYLSGAEVQVTVLDKLGLQQFDSPVMGLYRSFRNDDLNFGGGVYLNFSQNFTAAVSYSRVIDYSVSWPFAFLASDNATILAFDMNNNIHVDAIAPSFAMKFGNLSLGLTVDIYHVLQSAAFPQLNKAPADTGLEAYQFNINQKAWTYGFNLGIMADLSNDLRFGISVKSGYKAKLSGTAASNMFMDVNSAAYQTTVSSTFQFPWSIGAGILYQIEPGLRFNIDAVYNLWGAIQNSMNLKYGDQVWQNGLSHVDSATGIRANMITLEYNNTFDVGVGIEYMADEDTYIRAGYRFSQIPNSNATYSFLMPGVNQHALSIGIGYKGDSFTFDAGIVYSFGLSKKVTNNNNSNFNGEYKSDSYIPSITIRYSL